MEAPGERPWVSGTGVLHRTVHAVLDWTGRKDIGGFFAVACCVNIAVYLPSCLFLLSRLPKVNYIGPFRGREDGSGDAMAESRGSAPVWGWMGSGDGVVCA